MFYYAMAFELGLLEFPTNWWQAYLQIVFIVTRFASLIRFLPSPSLLDKSVELIAEPDREFYLFGQGLTVRFLIEYPSFIPDYVANSTKLFCTIKTPDESMLLDEGLSFHSGHDLVIGDSTNAESHRGPHVVNCSNKYIQRLKTISIFSKSAQLIKCWLKRTEYALLGRKPSQLLVKRATGMSLPDSFFKLPWNFKLP